MTSCLFVATMMSTLANESDRKQDERDLIVLTACEFPCCAADSDCGGGDCFCDTSYPGTNDGEGHCACPMAPPEPEPACDFPCCIADSDCGGGDCFCDTSYPGSNDGEGHCACPMAPPEPTSSPTEFNPDLQCMDLSYTNKTAVELVEETLMDPTNADFVEFRNIQASGHACYQYFTQGHAAGKHKVTGEYLLPESGIIMSTGDPGDFCENDSDQTTRNWFLGGDGDLTAIVQQTNQYLYTYDACTIEFEFQCGQGMELVQPNITFNYIFGSEEYYEYVSSDFNDAFAFFLNGENIAKLPNGDVVSIKNVNYDSNTEFFIGNDVTEASGIQYHSVEADGFTTLLTASAVPNDGWNSVKLVVADVADRILDSFVLLEAGSFKCLAVTDAPTPAPTKTVTDSPTTRPTKDPTASPSQKVRRDFYCP